MEEQAGRSCSRLVYYCASADEYVCELYRTDNLPPQAGSRPLDKIYGNVRILLDEDQGGFKEVFLSSDPIKSCDELETYANSTPIVVLVEVLYIPRHGTVSSSLVEDGSGSLGFLRSLSADIQGARFQKHVMPFAVLVSQDVVDAETVIGAAIRSSCLSAGALDIVRSPLRPEGINRLVGHVIEVVRPPARLVGGPMPQNLVHSIFDTSVPKLPCFRPDLTLSSLQKSTVETAVRRWNFPAKDLDMDELTYAALCMLEHILQVPELEPYSMPRAQLITFLLATRRQYKHENEVYYHNWRHAVDVTQSIYCFCLDSRICPLPDSDQRANVELSAVERVLTPLDGLILLVSAIGHDVGHPGVNNAFLVACNHPLAQMYNDKSVLENYHCAAYSQLLRRHWPSLSSIPGFRSTIISNILATDMQRHFEYMSSLGELKRKVKEGEKSVDEWPANEREHTRELLMALLMKAADISNVARPFEVSSHWARILMDEFARQGELEAELQIPTCLFGGPPNKEDVLAAAQSQKGFMSLFGIPLFQAIAEIMPTVASSTQELDKNQKIWDKRIEEEKQRRESREAQSHITFSGVTKDEAQGATGRRRSEPSVVAIPESRQPSTPQKKVPVAGVDIIPSKHPAHEHRQKLSHSVAFDDDKVTSAPHFTGNSVHVSPGNGVSRRSSKDVALDQLQQLSAFVHSSMGPGSRRGSGDAGWHIHQSYPSSRRGSKDESLTTILVTSGGTPGRRSSPTSLNQTRTSQTKQSGQTRDSGVAQASQKQRGSVPSSRSHATSAATTTTTIPHSPSITQPSSLASEGDEPTPPASHPSIPSTEDPFILPGNWPNDPADGIRRVSPLDGVADAALPDSPPQNPYSSALLRARKAPDSSSSPSPRILGRVASAGSEQPEDGRESSRKKVGDPPNRAKSRSRSRIRLKFWRKREKTSASVGEAGPEGNAPGSGSVSP